MFKGAGCKAEDDSEGTERGSAVLRYDARAGRYQGRIRGSGVYVEGARGRCEKVASRQTAIVRV